MSEIHVYKTYYLFVSNYMPETSRTRDTQIEDMATINSFSLLWTIGGEGTEPDKRRQLGDTCRETQLLLG